MYKTKNSLREITYPLTTFFIVLIVWQLMDFLFKIKEVILPNPLEILYQIVNNFGILISHTYITMCEAIFGFVVGSALALSTAILFVYSSKSKKALYPYAIALKATPLYALAPVLVVWFGNGMLSKIVMSAMVAFFPVLVGSVKGFTAIEPEALDLFKSFSASDTQIFSKLRFPSALPYILPSLKIATTLAVVGATIAEFTGATNGIGHLIVNSSYYLETSMMFAGIIFISIAGILFFYLIDLIEKKIVFWQAHD